jgi:cytochrome P450
MGKDPVFYSNLTPGSIVTATRDRHAYLRRQLSHAFSEKAMREQAPVINQFIDLLIQRLHAVCADGSDVVDIVSWFNVSVILLSLPFGAFKKRGAVPFGIIYTFAPMLTNP